jgi:hypothetical protein
MQGASERTGLKEFLDAFFAEVSGNNHTTLEKYIELERALLEQYQKYLADQLATNDEVLQNFTKLVMSSWLQVVAFQRENRTRFLALQSTIADAHLQFLQRISESVSTASPTPGASSDGD